MYAPASEILMKKPGWPGRITLILHQEHRLATPRRGVRRTLMLEIEMKFTVAEFAPIIANLHEWKARGQPAIQEADHYFNSPDRDFGKTDEAFRLRSIGVENRVTYKGPKQGGPTKTRTEIEIGLESGAKAADQFPQLLQHPGC